jgi:UPF0716 protein FxsA
VGPLLVVVFLLVPVVEIYVIIQVGQLIGPLPTIALLVIESLIGAWLLKREGRAAWLALQQAVASGRLPAQELVDAGLVLVGGTLLLAPGFLTDLIGFFFILPPTRPLARRLLLWLMVRRAARVAALHARYAGNPAAGRRPQPPRPQAPPRRSPPQEPPPRVVRGELVPGSTGVDPADQVGPDDEGPDRNKSPGRDAGG